MAGLTNDARIEAVMRLREFYADPVKWTWHVYHAMGFKLPRLAEVLVEDFHSTNDDCYYGLERGFGKTTIISAQVPWLTIMDTNTSTLFLSGVGALSSKIMAFVQKIFRTMPELSPMLPPVNGFEKQNEMRFDIAECLRPMAMSSTLQARAVNRIQGERGTYVIYDDIETINDYTPRAQEKLDAYLAEGTSIKYVGGRVVIVGTVQCKNSVYLRLPQKGFRCQVYPGRFPTPAQVKNYDGMLAPWIIDQISRDPSLQTGGGIDGTQGKPTSPEYADEQEQQDRESKMGSIAFQIRHMLNPKAFDNIRNALNPENLILINQADRYPIHLDSSIIDRVAVDVVGVPHNLLAPVLAPGVEYAEPSLIVTSVDPAFGGKVSRDRTAVVTVAFMGGYAVITGCRSLEGGFTPEIMEQIAQTVAKQAPHVLLVEKNADAGMFSSMLAPYVTTSCQALGVPVPKTEEVTARGKKEHRIIQALDPIMSGRKLCITQGAIDEHNQSLSPLSLAEAQENSLFTQIANMTEDGGLLKHDDAIDALAGAISYRATLMAIDSQKAQAEAATRSIIARANQLARNAGRLTSNSFINHARRI